MVTRATLIAPIRISALLKAGLDAGSFSDATRRLIRQDIGILAGDGDLGPEINRLWFARLSIATPNGSIDIDVVDFDNVDAGKGAGKDPLGNEGDPYQMPQVSAVGVFNRGPASIAIGGSGSNSLRRFVTSQGESSMPLIGPGSFWFETNPSECGWFVPLLASNQEIVKVSDSELFTFGFDNAAEDFPSSFDVVLAGRSDFYVP